MSTFQVSPGSLRQAGSQLQPAASALASVSIPSPNPMMYGKLVGSAASDAEPATTTSLNDVIHALGELFTATTAGIDTTSQCYVDHELDTVDLIRHTIEGMLR